MFDLLPLKRRGNVPSVFSEMDDLIKKMWYGFPFHNLEENMDIGWSPRLDVSETERSLQIVADLPGMEKKDIILNLEDNVLTIKGERKMERETKEKQYHAIERSSGSFYRALRLPVEVEKEQIEATFQNGVLTISIPKSKKTKKEISQIQIK